MRQHSYNTGLLHKTAQLLPAEHDFSLFDISAIPLYNQDLEADKRPSAVNALIEAINNADALLFASPEYNHGSSGSLRNAIDWASRPAFHSALASKPCGILTASKSPVGGARAQADLKNVLSSTLSLVVPSPEYVLGQAHDKCDSNGMLTDQQAIDRLQRYLQRLLDWTGRLQ